MGRPDGRGRGATFRDRQHAGEVLASELAVRLPEAEDRVVLALPRGGVPVAAPVSRRLRAPLGVLIVRKLGAPGRPELAMGAIALVGDHVEVVRNADIVGRLGVTDEVFARTRAHEEAVLRERARAWTLPPVPLTGREAVLVDDGLATGATMTVAVQAARAGGARAVVVAVPVGARQAVAALAELADAVVCALIPDHFWAVGQHYDDFDQTSDAEVSALLWARAD